MRSGLKYSYSAEGHVGGAGLPASNAESPPPAAAPSPADQMRRTIGRALGCVPSGVYVLTAGGASNGDMAMMASWVQQAAFEPPALSIAVARGRPIAQIVRSAGAFVVSVIGKDDSLLMKRFARGTKVGEDPFAGVAVRRTPGGIGYPTEALAFLDCTLLSVCDFGADHDLFVGRVIAGGLLKEGRAFIHQRGSGLHY